MPQLYDDIGVDYQKHRRPDPRLAAAIWQALGQAESVVNVGAGTGSYEPTDRFVVAVEPALTMIRQRQQRSVPVVQASATQLPFRDGSFAAALAILTVHHWPDRARGLTELARVARERIVLLTWDPAYEGFWLVQDYFPEILDIDRQIMPSLEELQGILGRLEVHPLPIPHDCVDGFLGAYWRRPQAYLEANTRRAISTFAKIHTLEAGLAQLREDIADGTWARRYGALLDRSALDLGYRLIVVRR